MVLGFYCRNISYSRNTVYDNYDKDLDVPSSRYHFC